MKYSILGCGWLGFPLAQHLIANGNIVYGSTTTEKKTDIFAAENITPYIIKIENNNIFGPIDAFLDSDVLIIDVPFSKQKETFKSYQKLAILIEKSTISKVLFISSTSVYTNTNGIVTEDMAFKVNPEKKTLVDLEKLFLQHSGFETTVIRFSGLIGRDRNPGNFFKEGSVVKNGMAPINLIHLDDCILIIHKICMTTFNGEIFNAAADTHPTKKDFYTAASNANKLVPATFLSNEDYNYKIISNEKLKQQLNYSLKYPDLMKLLQKNDPKRIA
jgi:nucleoside-diphosphate-sugar epimerase